MIPCCCLASLLCKMLQCPKAFAKQTALPNSSDFKKDATWTFAANMSCYLLRHAISCCFIPFPANYLMLFHAISCYFPLFLCHVMWCYFITFHAFACYVFLCHAISCYFKCWDVFNLSLNQLVLMRLWANSSKCLDSRWPCLQAKPVWCQGPKIAKILIEYEHL